MAQCALTKIKYYFDLFVLIADLRFAKESCGNFNQSFEALVLIVYTVIKYILFLMNHVFK